MKYASMKSPCVAVPFTLITLLTECLCVPFREENGLKRSGLLCASHDTDDAVGGPENAGVSLSYYTEI